MFKPYPGGEEYREYIDALMDSIAKGFGTPGAVAPGTAKQVPLQGCPCEDCQFARAGRALDLIGASELRLNPDLALIAKRAVERGDEGPMPV